MPSMQQLPAAVAVNPDDEVLLEQGGTNVTATVAQVLGTLPVGSGLVKQGGTVAADTTVLAPLDSPTLTGTPTAPTPAAADNSNRVATTAFVTSKIAASSSNASITLAGDIVGSGAGTITATLPPIVTPGTFSKVTVNAKGQVTAGAVLTATDINSALGFAPANTADISAAAITAAGTTKPRSAGARASDRLNVLDFGADPSGTGDSAPAFAAAMGAIPSGEWGQVWVPRGTYRLNSAVNQPSGRSVAMQFEDGANIVGPGYLGVDRVESRQGAYRQMQNAGGWFGFAPALGASSNPAFDAEYLYNTPQNSLSMRVGWDRRYTNTNLYGKYHTGIDIAEQKIHSWPNLYDNSSGWAEWTVVNGTTLDEASMSYSGLNTSAEVSEIDIVNNGVEAGWTWRSGFGNGVQGISVDPWGQNGNYGGHVLFAYGSVGSYDGNSGGLNQRWVSYPAVFSSGNPGTVPQNATVTVQMDLTAKATAQVAGGGVSGVTVTNGGGAYVSAPTVVFTGGGGTGAAGTAVMLNGAVVGVNITSAGSGYTSPPSVSFSGGGVASPATTTITLNPDGAHGSLSAVAAAINAAAIPNLRAAVTTWGGVVSRLVIFGTNPSDLGVLTLSGSALSALGIAAGSYSAPRGSYAVTIGGTGNVAPGDQLIVNGTVITVGGTGATSDVVNAINTVGLPGIKADTNGNGQIVITAWMPVNPGGLVLANPTGFNTLGKLGLNAGTHWPPAPPKGFATAYGELTSPVCQPTDQISIAATDLAGNAYGPVIVTLNGGDGSGWPAAVAASIQAALQAAGFYSSTFTTLSTAPAIVAVKVVGSGGNQGVYIRNTAGGTLILANARGAPLDTLGIAEGTYQPGGYSAASQTVFMAAEDAIAPQGRGIFLGGASNATDRTTWPNTPIEARGSFLHGLRLDKATLADNNALIVAPNHAIAWGSKGQGQTTVSAAAGTLQVNGAPVAMSAAIPTRLSQLANDAGYLTASNIPAAPGALLAGSGTAGVAGSVAIGANLSLVGGTLSATGTTLPIASTTVLGGVKVDGSSITISGAGVISAVASGVTSLNGRSGAVSLQSSDVTVALGYTPPSAAVSSVVSGAGLSGGTITGSGTLSLAPIQANSLLANSGSGSAVPTGVPLSANLSMASGTLDLAPTISPAAAVIGTAGSKVTITQTTDMGGYHPVVFSTSGTNTNVPYVFAMAGQGYLATAVADGTAANGSQRGIYAVDWQQKRGSASQVASGAYSVIAGGQNNTASGQGSFAGGNGSTASGNASFAFGSSCMAAGANSVALGNGANDGGAYGKIVFSGGASSGAGQLGITQIYAGNVTAATRMTADGGAANAANSLPIRTDHAIGGTLTVTARNILNGDGAVWSVPILYRNSAGMVSVTSPGTAAIAPTAADSSLGTAAISVAADTANKGLAVTITPPSGVTLNASGIFIASEM
jgi:hypothetical protein